MCEWAAGRLSACQPPAGKEGIVRLQERRSAPLGACGPPDVSKNGKPSRSTLFIKNEIAINILPCEMNYEHMERKIWVEDLIQGEKLNTQ